MDGAQASSGTPSAKHEDPELCRDSGQQPERTISLLRFGEGAAEAVSHSIEVLEGSRSVTHRSDARGVFEELGVGAADVEAAERIRDARSKEKRSAGAWAHGSRHPRFHGRQRTRGGAHTERQWATMV